MNNKVIIEIEVITREAEWLFRRDCEADVSMPIKDICEIIFSAIHYYGGYSVYIHKPNDKDSRKLIDFEMTQSAESVGLSNGDVLSIIVEDNYDRL